MEIGPEYEIFPALYVILYRQYLYVERQEAHGKD